ncbi:hypothetical protein [Effusibacillus lacus]|uniref:Uncharacterized protein n=1 Tax=Effusibacillus lacus TaxID=1348429 RepID=A0A292YBW6_9BACL|nr:hypothetical protein [Effusibacillus lacus]TCS74719.1 hypothetical protein EDD64_1115 [Effusibacillus lacus]GAX88532.1 hypothetical protein EFBL_0141 [Effusibacillus lacus]
MAGKPQQKPASKPGGKKKKSDAHPQPQMKIVTVDTCIACPAKCQRGIVYMNKMGQPGAIGYGVPCILTLK